MVEPKDVVQQAIGYYELGLLAEADDLLDRGVPEALSVEYLHLRILVKIDREQWAEAEAFSTQGIDLFPERSFGYIQRAYALHELKRTREAAEVLEKAPVDSKDKVEDILAYNLACYYAQLGEDQRALEMLREAIRHNSALWQDACEDPDFASLHGRLDGLKP